MARWRVDIIGKELQNLGTVDAPNAWEALAKAVDLFDIHPALRSKTVSRSLRNRSRPLSASSLTEGGIRHTLLHNNQGAHLGAPSAQPEHQYGGNSAEQLHGSSLDSQTPMAASRVEQRSR